MKDKKNYIWDTVEAQCYDCEDCEKCTLLDLYNCLKEEIEK